jgi:hypothetical protein
MPLVADVQKIVICRQTLACRTIAAPFLSGSRLSTPLTCISRYGDGTKLFFTVGCLISQTSGAISIQQSATTFTTFYLLSVAKDDEPNAP